MGQQSQNDKRAGQLNLFGAAAAGPSAVSTGGGGALPEMDEIASADLLKFEKELLGFYITADPLTERQSAPERYSTHSTKDALNVSEGTEVTIGGMIKRVKTSITKNGRSAGQKMGWITLEDLEGSIEGVLWAETLADITAKYPDVISPEKIVFVKGRVDRKRETPSLQINEVIPVEEAIAKLTTSLVVKLDERKHKEDVVEQLGAVVKQHGGRTPLWASVAMEAGKTVTLRL